MMKQNKLDEQWLNEIRQTMADHEEELPADGWEKIAAAMGAAEEVQPEKVQPEEVRPEIVTEQSQPVIETKQPRIVPLWLRRAAAAVLLGGIGAGGMYYFSEQPSSNVPVLTDVEQMPENTSPEITTPEITPSAVTTASDSASVQQTKATPLLAKATHTIKQQHPEVKPLDETIEVVSSSETEAETIIGTASETISEPVSESEKTSETLSDMRQEEQSVLLAMESGSERRKSYDRSWNMGVRLGRNGSTDFDLGGREEDSYTSSTGPMYSNPTPSDSTNQSAMNLPQTRGERPEQKDIVLRSEKHLSWSVGISVSKRLDERLSFESGLVYTYLSSEVEMSLSGRQHQQLHYLGIPLKLDITLVESEHWQFYTSAGTMLEHSLFGKRGSTNLHLNDWQWSINGGLGLQYKLTKHMGLYIEPGVNYYFSNGSDVPSLRTESPFSVNLQIGVRFGL